MKTKYYSGKMVWYDIDSDDESFKELFSGLRLCKKCLADELRKFQNSSEFIVFF